MNELIRDIDIALLMYLKGERSGVETRNKILSLMGENEIGVSDAPERKHGVLHDVRESHASEVTEQHQALDEGALEKITEDGNLDFLCVETDMGKPKCKIQCPYCERV